MDDDYKGNAEEEGKKSPVVQSLDEIEQKDLDEEISTAFNDLRNAFLEEDKEKTLEILKFLAEKEGTKEFNNIMKNVDKNTVLVLPYLFNAIISSSDESLEGIENEIISLCIRIIVCIVSTENSTISDILPEPPKHDNMRIKFISNLHKQISAVLCVNCYDDCLTAVKSLLLDEKTRDMANEKFPIVFFKDVVRIMLTFDEEKQKDCINSFVLILHAFIENGLVADDADEIVGILNESNGMIENSDFAKSYMCKIVTYLIDERVFDFHKANSVDLIHFVNDLLSDESDDVAGAAASLMQRIISNGQLPKNIVVDISVLFGRLEAGCSQSTYLSVSLLIKEIVINELENACYLDKLYELYESATSAEKSFIANIVAAIVISQTMREKCFTENVIHLLCDALLLNGKDPLLISSVPDALGYLKLLAEEKNLLDNWFSIIEDYKDEIIDLIDELESEFDDGENVFLDTIKAIFYDDDSDDDGD